MNWQSWWQSLSPNERAAYIAYPGILLTGGIGFAIAAYNKKSASKVAKIEAPSVTPPVPDKNAGQNTELENSVQGIEGHPITPKQITDTIRSAPPYSQNTIAQSFRGIEVVWELKIWLMHFDNRGSVQIAFRDDDDKDFNREVRCLVDVETNPTLKVARENDRYKVSGKIGNAGPYNVEVLVSKFEYQTPRT